jgi:superfamily II DNA helicase RecQ
MGLDISNVGMVIHWQHPSSIEDYLQEFGRAGRDGEAAVAVLLYGRSSRRDIGLLNFMADKAVGNARLLPAEALAASSHKAAQIDGMARLATSRGCFREALVGYFTGPKRVARRSFSTWLLELVFADRGTRQQSVIMRPYRHMQSRCAAERCPRGHRTRKSEAIVRITGEGRVLGCGRGWLRGRVPCQGGRRKERGKNERRAQKSEAGMLSSCH